MKLLYLIMVFSLLVVDANAKSLDRTIAKVNEDILTESDLAEVIGDFMGGLGPPPAESIRLATSETLASLLDRTLLLQAAKKMKIHPPSDEINKQVETMVSEVRTKFGSEKEFRLALAQDHLSLEDLQDELLKKAKVDYQVFHVINSRFSVTASDVKQYEQENAGRGDGPVSYRLRRLAIPIKGNASAAAADEVRAVAAKILSEGLSFEEGIRKYSKAPGAREDGGDLGYLSASKLAKPVLAAVENLNPGQASGTVLAGGYANIFYVEGKKGTRGTLTQKRFAESKDALLQELRRKADLTIFDERLRKLLPDSYKSSARAAKSGAVEPVTQSSTAAPGQSAVQPSTWTPVPSASPTPEPGRRKGLFGAFGRQ